MSWMASTLFFVRDVGAAIDFYVGRLGFTLNMRYEEEGKARVAGVSRGEGCALLLTDQWPDKVGAGVLYTALGKEDFDRACAEFEANGVAVEEGFWGKPTLIVTDPAGNQIYFARP